MISIVKAVFEMDALVNIMRIILFERVENANLDAARIAVFLYGTNNLNGNVRPRFAIVALHHLAKGSLAEQAHYFI